VQDPANFNDAPTMCDKRTWSPIIYSPQVMK
jgi:hypothetical protein